jgi:hypothetical protein
MLSLLSPILLLSFQAAGHAQRKVEARFSQKLDTCKVKTFSLG